MIVCTYAVAISVYTTVYTYPTRNYGESIYVILYMHAIKINVRGK